MQTLRAWVVIAPASLLFLSLLIPSTFANRHVGFMRRLGLGQTADGVVVQSVDPNSEAAEKGIQNGDIILKVSGKDVKSPGDVVDGVNDVKKAGKSSVLLLLRSQDQQRFVALSVKKS